MRFVNNTKLLDYVLPLTIIFLLISRQVGAATSANLGIRVEPNGICNIILAIVIALVGVGIVRGERLAFIAFAATSTVIGTIQGIWSPFRIIFPNGAHRIHSNNEIVWLIFFCGAYCLFRAVTGGSGQGPVRFSSRQAREIGIEEKTAMSWGAQRLSISDQRVWIFASLVVMFSILATVFFLDAPDQNSRTIREVGAIFLIVGSVPLGWLGGKRAYAEVQTGHVTTNWPSICASSIALIGAFCFATYATFHTG